MFCCGVLNLWHLGSPLYFFFQNAGLFAPIRPLPLNLHRLLARSAHHLRHTQLPSRPTPRPTTRFCLLSSRHYGSHLSTHTRWQRYSRFCHYRAPPLFCLSYIPSQRVPLAHPQRLATRHKAHELCATRTQQPPPRPARSIQP